MKEFDLSKKIEEHVLTGNVIQIEDVKEFIRRNDEDLQKVRNGEITIEEAINRIKIRAGEELSK